MNSHGRNPWKKRKRYKTNPEWVEHIAVRPLQGRASREQSISVG
ncbi:MAG: hypothetical protein P9L92_03735 [Candidatus Electryonea clarkiae]|nr:hypothetical protein [Candidatus Electryonea clarkiae]MDP8288747.1 hypothetical protein [Candidatus Electryonea clarkiae]